MRTSEPSGATTSGVAGRRLVSQGMAARYCSRWRSSVAAGGIAAAVMRRATRSHADVHRGVLPEWARTGFSDPEPRIAHVMGRSGLITAILFGDPLQAAVGRDRTNKILWVARDPVQPLSDLVIRAADGRAAPCRHGRARPLGDRAARRLLADEARWSGRQDSLDLRYVRSRHNLGPCGCARTSPRWRTCWCRGGPGVLLALVPVDSTRARCSCSVRARGGPGRRAALAPRYPERVMAVTSWRLRPSGPWCPTS